MKVKIKSVPKANHGISMLGDGNIQPISNDIIQFNGPSHSDGGIPINWKGNTVEVEGGETAFRDRSGDLNIMGNMEVPGTKRKFKNVFKSIAKQETKLQKAQDTAVELINTTNPFDPFQALSFNSGRAKGDAAKQKQMALDAEKQALVDTQNFMLDLADQTGRTPEYISKKMKNGGKITAKNGHTVTPDNQAIGQLIVQKAKKYGIDPKTLSSMIYEESSGFTSAVAPMRKGVRARGLVQFTPDTAKMYGVEDILNSNKPEDIDRVVDAGAKHFKSLLDNNGGDYKLALVAYNGGQGAVNFVKKKLGKDTITGDEWMNFMFDRRKLHPSSKESAWQNETYNHVNKVVGGSGIASGSTNAARFAAGARQKQPEVGDWNYEWKDLGIKLPAGSEEEANLLASAPTQSKVDPLLGPSAEYLSSIQPTTAKSGVAGTSRDYDRDSYKSLADSNNLGITDFLSEIPAVLDQPDYVQGQTYNPSLYEPYQVSFQDRLNENNATFRAIAQQMSNNPAALATLAAQKYQADNSILGEQFRTNQGIINEVANKNVQILNDAELKNLALADQQAERQAQNKAVTENRREVALASISNKVAQNRKDNTTIRLYENMFQYRPDEKYGMTYIGGDAPLDYSGAGASSNSGFRKKRDAQGNIITSTEIIDPQYEQDNQWLDYANKRRAAGIATSRYFR